MKIEKIKIELLTPYENNAKEHSQEQIDQIKQSILTYGMNDPIGVWGKQNIIVEGHGRVIALQQLGYEEVECIRLDHLSEEERKAYTLIHNKLTMNTDFNFEKIIVNPLGDWTGGLNVDTGATNRKLGSDMAQSVTGGGLHGKDLSKADVSVNIYAFLKAKKTNKVVELCCAIGDEEIDGKPYEEIVETAREYIMSIGGFEKFAEWGLF